jgi:hypothetical protein
MKKHYENDYAEIIRDSSNDRILILRDKATLLPIATEYLERGKVREAFEKLKGIAEHWMGFPTFTPSEESPPPAADENELNELPVV